MVRAPCCEKMGLKKGPWSLEEDQLLISHIQEHGHANWRALPKQAGLLRCGKSCRLRWINYLRPDIKRGNLSAEEEESIIKLHQVLGNRWSAIAASLPGRTDNEIKNVWHTHLKKRLNPNQETKPQPKKRKLKLESNIKKESETTGIVPMSPQPSCSEVSSITTGETNQYIHVKDEQIESFENFPEIDESFWSEALSSSIEENSVSTIETTQPQSQSSFPLVEPGYNYSLKPADDCMNFWYNVFLTSGDESTLTPLFEI